MEWHRRAPSTTMQSSNSATHWWAVARHSSSRGKETSLVTFCLERFEIRINLTCHFCHLNHQNSDGTESEKDQWSMGITQCRWVYIFYRWFHYSLALHPWLASTLSTLREMLFNINPWRTDQRIMPYDRLYPRSIIRVLARLFFIISG